MRMLHLLTAACMGTSALMWAAPATAETVIVDKSVVVDKAMLNLPPGITAKDLNADKSIEKSFKGITDDAMSKTGFDNLVSYLVDQDRDRIKKSTDKSLTNLDGNKNKQLTDVIASLDGAFNAKYNHKFDLDYKMVYTADFLHIATGEVSDATLLAGKWPVDAMMMAPAGGKLTPGEADVTKAKNFGGDINLEKGRNVAIAHMKASHGMPALTASLIHENLGGFRFDIPNNMTAQMLYDNLVNNLSFLDSHRDQWPADINDGYRAFSHAVTAALYNIDLQKMPKTGTAVER